MSTSSGRTHLVNAVLIAFAAGASGFALFSYSRFPELVVAAQVIVYCLVPALVAVTCAATRFNRPAAR